MLTLRSPYWTDGYAWLRGNLHCHTTLSDGTGRPEEMIATYERLGYDFLALTDHDVHAPAAVYQPSTRLVLIPGVEISARGPHLLQLGLAQALEPLADRQQMIDAVAAQGGLTVLNHPNWGPRFNHFPQEHLEQLHGAAGLEVYNGVIERLEGAALATDRWDLLLSQGKHVWGYGTDDAHGTAETGLAWTTVQAAARTPEAVLDALRAGRCYASTGVTIEAVRVDGPSVTVETRDAQRIRFVTRWGMIRHTAEGSRATWEAPDTRDAVEMLRYVRVECYGRGGLAAWTQPLTIERTA
jgi:hypothetical protein